MLAFLAAVGIIFSVVLLWVLVQRWSGEAPPEFQSCHSLGETDTPCQRCGMKDECHVETPQGPTGSSAGSPR